MGWGQIGQHRKTGAKGGHGMAGGHKHKWTKLIKTDYFGKHGFHNPTTKEIREININGLATLADKLNQDTINLVELGYDKLVGKGVIKRPLTVIVKMWSRMAEEKIVGAGGKIIKPEEIQITRAE